MIEQIKNKIIEKLYDEFRVILYKELDITMDQFIQFMKPLDKKINFKSFNNEITCDKHL